MLVPVQRAMDTNIRAEVRLSVILTGAMDEEVKWFSSRFGRFTQRKEPLVPIEQQL
jgi:hypothetical protein